MLFGKLRLSLKWICWNFQDPRSFELVRGRQRSNLKIDRIQTCDTFLETSKGKDEGFILTLGVSDLLRLLEVIRGQMLKSTKPRHVIPVWRALDKSMQDSIQFHKMFSSSNDTFVPQVYHICGTCGTYYICTTICGTQFNQPLEMQYPIISLFYTQNITMYYIYFSVASNNSSSRI